MSNADELKKLKELLDSGVLSKEEFEIEKSKIIATKDSSSKYEDNLGKKVRNSKKTIVYASIALVVIMIGVFYFVNTNNKSIYDANRINNSLIEDCELVEEQLRTNTTGALTTLKKFVEVVIPLKIGDPDWDTIYKESKEPIKVVGFYIENIEELSPDTKLVKYYKDILEGFIQIEKSLELMSTAAYNKNSENFEFGWNKLKRDLDELGKGLDGLNQSSC